MAVIISHPLLARIVATILGTVEPLGTITHFVLLDLNYPANLWDFFKNIFPLITLDLIPTDYVYEEIFALESIDDESESEIFEEVGYENRLAVNNIGSLLIFIFL